MKSFELAHGDSIGASLTDHSPRYARTTKGRKD
jgi:hypothetical protein